MHKKKKNRINSIKNCLYVKLISVKLLSIYSSFVFIPIKLFFIRAILKCIKYKYERRNASAFLKAINRKSFKYLKFYIYSTKKTCNRACLYNTIIHT